MTEPPEQTLLRGFVLGLRVPEPVLKPGAVVSEEDAAARKERDVEWEQRADEWEKRRRTLIWQLHELDEESRRAEQQHHQQGPGRAEPGGREAEPARPWRRRRRAVLGAATAVALLVAVCLALWLGSPASSSPSQPKVALTGKVICVSGATVAGVWVDAGPGGLSNFASFRAAGRPSAADFAYAIPPGTPYSVHVGCGLRPGGGWVNEDWSDQVTGGSVTFLCSDVPAVYYGTCRPATS